MGEPVFFQAGPGLTVSEIIALTGAVARNGSDLNRKLSNVGPIDRAGPHDLTFLDSAKFAEQLSVSYAGAVLTTPRFVGQVPSRVVALAVKDPYRAFVQTVEALFPHAQRPSSLFPAGSSPTATIDPSARLEDGVTIDPGAVIGPRAEIGSGTVIAANAVIGPEVRIGRDCAIGAGASITHALIGDRVIIHPGVRIGQDGFAFLPGRTSHQKIPQIARVIIQDRVEIGANTTVDRGGLRDTVIGEGSKIDNLVQIAHNVVIGRHCLIAAQVGVSGSSTVGDYTMMGGQVGIADNITVGEGVQLAAKSGVMSAVPDGARWGGAPARPIRDLLRTEVLLARMANKLKDGEKESGE